MLPKTSYDTIDDFGLLYDQVPAYAARGDVVFYLSEAGKSASAAGSIIELGCGTGRILLPLARAGHHVTGIDSSVAMLARLGQHLETEPGDVRGRVTIRQADVRDFAVTPPASPSHSAGFALAIAPFRVLQHLTSPSDQLRCLSTIRHHLQPGGRLVFDVFNPHYPLMASDRSTETEETPELRLADGRSMRRSVRVSHVRWREQTIDIELIYDVRDANGTVTRSVQSFPMRWYGPAELEHLLARAGFRVTVMYGDFDRSALRDGSPEIVVVAERDG